MFTWSELKSVLHVEQLDTNLYRGSSLSLGLTRVFGGQVLAQCLNAAYRSVDGDKVPHSLHGYFLRPGDFNKPIIYEVDPIRNGKSFSTRRVVAIQNGEAIFNSSISFHRIEDGPSHQFDMPDDISGPEQMPSDADELKKISATMSDEHRERVRSNLLIFPKDIIDLRSPFIQDFLQPGPHDPEAGFWFKFTKDVGDDPIMHLTLLAYISDKALMATGIRPHGVGFFKGNMMGASLDHAMWFHGNVDVRDWNYYHMESPRSGRARSFNRGSFYHVDGRLIASTAQEGLCRKIRPKS